MWQADAVLVKKNGLNLNLAALRQRERLNLKSTAHVSLQCLFWLATVGGVCLDWLFNQLVKVKVGTAFHHPSNHLATPKPLKRQCDLF
jgi:hypothetical protein